MTEYNFVGVDVAKNKFDVALWMGDKKFKQKQFTNTKSGRSEFSKWLGKNTTNPRVCMEATGHYSEQIAEYLCEQKVFVSIVNPHQIKSFGRSKLARNKNDRIDAQLIAEFNQKMQPDQFKPRSPEQKAQRELIDLLNTLKNQLTQLKNKLECMQSALGKKQIKKAIKQLEAQIEKLEKEIDKSTSQNQEYAQALELLLSITGVGKTTAQIILAYLPHIKSFDSAKALAAYIGVSPKQCQSGKYVGQTRLCKFGNSRLRKALYMPALVMKNHNSHMQPFIRRLEANGLKPKAIVGAVMRKLVHIIYGILKHGQPFNPALACKA